MWPSTKKEVYTTQGLWLRKIAAGSMTLDYLFFVFALAIVGFDTMIMDLFIGLIGYSVYLTLREWVIILYCLFKTMAALTLVFGNSGASYGNS